jgi:hypothetical protein
MQAAEGAPLYADRTPARSFLKRDGMAGLKALPLHIYRSRGGRRTP